ncbi:hypothetical protein NDU88_004055 [Pleurodeles waltl]|uniref:Uncharacterized protein n=1 Tax=Pleurodeles waltl TaxID=8319 RepID=A0AAV7V3M1_PLEWA|nr:hypothetical protein NDU88_004055 [Pleurodeles waltl]
MGRHKQAAPSQRNTLEDCTNSTPLPQHQAQQGGLRDKQTTAASAKEPSCAELIAAIEGLRVAFKGKIETVALEVNLLLAELRKVSDKVRVVKGSIVELQTEVTTLRRQLA